MRSSKSAVQNTPGKSMLNNIQNNLIIVTLILGMVILAGGILSPVMPLYLTSIGVSPAILGLMFAISSAGMAVTEATWGWIADRIGPKIPLIMATLMCGLLIFSFTLTKNVPSLFFIFLFWGIGQSAVFGPTRGYVGTHTPALKRATFMAVNTSIMIAAGCFGNLPSGMIADAWGFQNNFYIACGICLIAGIILIQGLKIPLWPKPAPADPSARMIEDGQPQSRASNYRAIGVQCLVAALIMVGTGIALAFLPLLATQKAGLNASQVGIIYFIAGFAAVGLAVPLGKFADNIGHKRVMIIGLLIASVSLAGIALAGSFLWLALSFAAFQLSELMFTSASLALLSQKTPPRRQSTIMGIYGAVGENTGLIAGQALGGFAWTAWGSGTFLIGTISCGLGVIICTGLVNARGLITATDKT
jgi:MFS transporter, PPP family, 3-phenylpropionic acid transporter